MEDKGETITVQRLAGFRTVFVFDIAQTDGQPLASLPTSAAEGGEELLGRLEEATKTFRIVLSYEEPQEAGLEGYSMGGRIVVRKSLHAAAKSAVLVHEIAHELLHQNENRAEGRNKSRAQRELEAEATAYVVMHHFGIGHVAAFYLASYAINGEQLKAALETISVTAKRIIQAAEERESGVAPELCA